MKTTGGTEESKGSPAKALRAKVAAANSFALSIASTIRQAGLPVGDVTEADAESDALITVTSRVGVVVTLDGEYYVSMGSALERLASDDKGGNFDDDDDLELEDSDPLASPRELIDYLKKAIAGRDKILG